MARPNDEPQPSLLDYFYIEAAEDDSTLSFDNWNASYNLSSSFDRISWTALTSNVIATGVNAGTKVYLIGNTTTLGSTSSYSCCSPTSDKKYKLGGKVFSLFSERLEPKTLTNQNDLYNWQKSKTNLIEFSADLEPMYHASYMFYECSNLSALSDGFNSANVYTAYMFYNCTSLIKFPDEFDGSNLKDGSYMFYNCNKLTALPDGFTGRSINCSYMFYSCSSLSALPDGFSCPNATNTSWMFYNCSSLSALPDGFNCSKTSNAASMFLDCNNLTTIGNNVKIGTYSYYKPTKDTTYMGKSHITSIGDNFEWFTHDTFSGTWDPALGIRNVFPNATTVGSGWKVYNHYDGE